MAAHLSLRTATAPDHAVVDAAFARFDLADRASYGDFLVAHARAVPVIEALLNNVEGGPVLRQRTPGLAADLADLDLPLPPVVAIAPPASTAEAWGMAYVLEGSRLGGGLLARQVGAGLPDRYLRDTHLSGEWRGFIAALDAALMEADAIERASSAARRIFAAYRLAAESR